VCCISTCLSCCCAWAKTGLVLFDQFIEMQRVKQAEIHSRSLKHSDGMLDCFRFVCSVILLKCEAAQVTSH